ncbi:MAG: trypsin-like peptidase domain-containing protein [Streptococcaceae bacterium]|jgi:serine protease Do|nr:trypsin-like peptidase domain-containing protein [Streptococcaceae bacterium]
MQKTKGFLTGLVGGVVGASLVLGGNYVYNEFTQPPTTTQNQTSHTTSNNKTATTNVNVDISTGITAAVEKAKPAVVSVINLQKPSNTQSDIWGNLFGNGNGNGNGNNNNNENTNNSSLQPASEGSGVIYKKEGGKAYIVTNNHVVAGSDSLEIQLSDGTSVKGELVGTDAYTDLAVITIADKGIETVAEFADSSKLNVGEPAIAIGSPLGTDFANTVTSGIVSALARSVTNRNDQNELVNINAIQTDAAINPGNSGGPLVNIKGQVIGINSSKIAASSSGTGVEGMGFAIPSNDVTQIIAKLEKDGKVARPGIGITSVSLSDLNATQMDSLKLPKEVTQGVLVVSTTKDWPAATAGLKEMDVITKLGGKDVSDSTALQSILFSHSVGDTIEVEFYRDGKKHNEQMKLDRDFSQLSQKQQDNQSNSGD